MSRPAICDGLAWYLSGLSVEELEDERARATASAARLRAQEQAESERAAVYRLSRVRAEERARGAAEELARRGVRR